MSSKPSVDVERVRRLILEAIEASRDWPFEGDLWDAQCGLLHALSALVRHDQGEGGE